jgi:hypothetical protein
MKTQCRACDKFFVGTTAFDAHRVGSHEVIIEGRHYASKERRCLSTEELIAKNFQQNERGQWQPIPTEEQLEWFRTLKEKNKGEQL